MEVPVIKTMKIRKMSLSSDCFRGVADGECPGVNVQSDEAGNNFGRRANFGGTGGHFGGMVEGGEEEKTMKHSLTLDNQNCSVGIQSIPVSD